jgi:alkylation response protein AidB-like acyl-CoA dehydrogenase
MMDFAPTPAQQALCDAARAFARETLDPGTAERDAAGADDPAGWRRLWQAAADHGLLGLCIPTALGGGGHDVLTAVLVLEAVGEGCRDNGLTLGLNGQVWAMQMAIMEFGTEAQQARWMPGLVSGRVIACHGVTEDGSGSDVNALAMTAEKDGGDYVLNGAKTLVGMATEADLALVFARTNPALGAWGMSCFLVETDRPGVTRGPKQPKMGLRSVPMGRIGFRDVRVPADALLGREGAGGTVFARSIEWERRFIFTSHVGSMRRQLDDALAFARTRKVHGGPIIAHQSVSNRLVDMQLRYETARLMLHRAAWQMATGRAGPMDAALTKLHLSEAFAASSLDAMRTYGGAGYLAGSDAERDLRDATGGVLYAGTSDIQRHLVAGLMRNATRRR